MKEIKVFPNILTHNDCSENFLLQNQRKMKDFIKMSNEISKYQRILMHWNSLCSFCITNIILKYSAGNSFWKKIKKKMVLKFYIYINALRDFDLENTKYIFYYSKEIWYSHALWSVLNHITCLIWCDRKVNLLCIEEKIVKSIIKCIIFPLHYKTLDLSMFIWSQMYVWKCMQGKKLCLIYILIYMLSEL